MNVITILAMLFIELDERRRDLAMAVIELHERRHDLAKNFRLTRSRLG